MAKSTEIQKAKRKALRRESTVLEKILSNLPKFGRIELGHMHHRNRTIAFSAWIGDNPIYFPFNHKEVVVDRREILNRGENFFKDYEEDFKWLTTINEDDKPYLRATAEDLAR